MQLYNIMHDLLKISFIRYIFLAKQRSEGLIAESKNEKVRRLRWINGRNKSEYALQPHPSIKRKTPYNPEHKVWLTATSNIIGFHYIWLFLSATCDWNEVDYGMHLNTLKSNILGIIINSRHLWGHHIESAIKSFMSQNE